jgi:hypothetical protein
MNYTEQVTAKVEPSLRRRMEEFAAKHERPMGQVLRMAVKVGMAELEKSAPPSFSEMYPAAAGEPPVEAQAQARARRGTS